MHGSLIGFSFIIHTQYLWLYLGNYFVVHGYQISFHGVVFLFKTVYTGFTVNLQLFWIKTGFFFSVLCYTILFSLWPAKQEATGRKLVSKWHATTKGTLRRNYRVPSKSEGRRLLKAVASLLSEDDHFTDATSHKVLYTPSHFTLTLQKRLKFFFLSKKIENIS